MANDPTTQSNYRDIKVNHVAFEFDVNFDTKIVDGYVELHAQALNESVSELVLDTRDLTILSADLVSGPGLSTTGPVSLPFELGSKDPILGSALRISLPQPLSSSSSSPSSSSLPLSSSSSSSSGDATKSNAVVGVRFRTSPSSSALQFMRPEQTRGGVYPFLFSQCETIHARSLAPCQDTPAVKSTYKASVRVPKPLQALMSALLVEDSDEPTATSGTGDDKKGDGDKTSPGEQAALLPHVQLPESADPAARAVFRFRQSVPVPIYLLALAAGRLDARDLGPRSRVWAEPETVEAAAFEFAETAKFLETGERLAGTPYVWGRYDLLVMPPSFPYGGMENPCVTFVTPTLLVGDRSLTNVVAHEISHSWTGNLVTNATWEHFWLNEGWTRLLETKILGTLSDEATLQFLWLRSAMTMRAEITRLGGSSNPFTQLVWNLDGKDPDDAFSSVPYEKGLYFLNYLQALVGGPKFFDPFVKHYIATFKFVTVDSDQFKNCFLEFYAARGVELEASDAAAAVALRKAISGIDWDAWLHAPGMPPAENVYDNSLVRECFKLADRWFNYACSFSSVDSNGSAGGFDPSDIVGWSTEQTVAFLEKLTELLQAGSKKEGAGSEKEDAAPMVLPLAVAEELARTYALFDCKNPEISVPFYRLALASGDLKAVPPTEALLRAQGRMKYIRPLYREMYRQPLTKDDAIRIFQEVRRTYHPIAEKMVAQDLGLN